MKKILLLLTAIIITATGFTQVYKYRAYQTQLGEDAEWVNRNILVTINIDKDKIHIFGQKETDLSILYAEPKIEKYDGTAYFYQAVDQDGDKCDVMFKRFNPSDNENIATLCITYQGGTLSFRLKND